MDDHPSRPGAEGAATSRSDRDELVVENFGFVRRLAAVLVHDADLAEDLAQQTLLQALEKPPRHAANPRGWLATVLRNLVQQHGRRRTLEQRHERRLAAEPGRRAAAAGEASAATDEVVERATVGREVVAAVLDLPEPSRTAVLLRYLDDLPPREIASRLGVPVSTVHTRITRGLHLLRTRLDATHGGDRSAWVLPLVPIVGPPLVPPTAAPAAPLADPPLSAATPAVALTSVLGVLTMKTTLLCVAGAALALTTWMVWPGASEPVAANTAQHATDPKHASALDPVDGPTAPDDDTTTVRRLVETPDRPASDLVPPAPTTASGWLVHGLLVDIEARPLAGTTLRRSEDSRGPRDETRSATGADDVTLVRTGTDGRFTIEDDGRGPRSLELVDEGWSLAIGARLPTTSVEAEDRELTLVAAPAVRFAGVVVDDGGRPVAGARLAWGLPELFRARFAARLDDAILRVAAVTTGSDGRFELPPLPAIEGAAIGVHHPEHLPQSRAAALTGDASMRIQLLSPTVGAGTIAGRVVLADGGAAPGALVSAGATVVRADADGMFVLDVGADRRDGIERVTAVLPGHQAVLAARPGSTWPNFVELRLGDAPLAIRGRVVDADGRPLADVRVWSCEPETFGRFEGGLVTTQGLVAEHATPEQEMARIRALPNDDERWRSLLSTPSAAWPFCRTDASGRFELGGLTAGIRHRLRAMDDDTMVSAFVEGIDAGAQDVVIRMATDACWPRLEGTLRTRGGLPVPGATLRLQTDTVSLTLGEGASTRHYANRERVVRTDAEGRFALTRVPFEAAYVRIDGPDIIPEEFGRHVEGGLRSLAVHDGWTDEGTKRERLDIVVEARLLVRVHLAEAGSAERLEVLDEAGRRMPVHLFEAHGRSTFDSYPFDEEGRTPALTLPESARTLVLRKGDDEVRRLPIPPLTKLGEVLTVEG
jgi:RNA polymerase sigma-70 factor (ECF subfamily)